MSYQQTIKIELNQQKSLTEVYAYLSECLKFDVGDNLDALYDVLSTDVSYQLIVVLHRKLSKIIYLGNSYRSLKAVLEAVQETRDDFIFYEK